MRLFVAVYPPAEVVRDLSKLVDQLSLRVHTRAGRNVRLTPEEQWHVTVAFLGEVEDARFDDVKAALTAAVRSWHVDRAALPVLRISGGGRFNRGPATVVWAGLHGDVASLTSLSATVSKQLGRVKLPVDDKPFRPHLTLARPGDRLDRSELDTDLARLDLHCGPVWTVTELALVRSQLGPRPLYDTLAVFPLG